MRPSWFAAAGLLLLCACSQPMLAQGPPPPATVTPPAAPRPPATATPPAERQAPILTRAEVRQGVAAHLYTQPGAETLVRSANGSLQGQRVEIRGQVRRVQLGDDTTHYAANGWRARNWVTVDMALPGAAVDGQVSVLYNGDISVLRAGQPVTVFGRVQGYDAGSTNGFAAKPGPPLVVAEFIAERIGP